MISGIRITAMADVQSGIPEKGQFERRQAGFETRQAGFETSSHPFFLHFVRWMEKSLAPMLGDDRQLDAGQIRRRPKEKVSNGRVCPSFNTTRKQVNNKAELARIAYGSLSERHSRCDVTCGGVRA
ncbi:MAG TPA: hypothetical protein VGM05_03170 [Planctomycetaceae bacterium]|jgi:hypothetical protein